MIWYLVFMNLKLFTYVFVGVFVVSIFAHKIDFLNQKITLNGNSCWYFEDNTLNVPKGDIIEFNGKKYICPVMGRN